MIIKTNPIDEILPLERDEYLVKIQKHLSDLLKEIIFFGTHILQWDIEKNKNLGDNSIPTLYFRNILDLSDSISTLINSSSIDSSKILLRSLIENSLCLTYMIEKNEKQRALSFIVAKTNRQIKYYRKFLNNEQVSKQFKIQMEKDDLELDFEKYMDKPEIKKFIESKRKLLSSSELSEIQKEYSKSLKKTRNPNWFSLFNGPNTIEQLALRLKKSVRYEFFYRAYSENVHGQDLLKGFSFVSSDKAQIIQIRDFEHTQKVTFDTASILLETYNIFLKKRNQDKLTEFRNWYSTIRESFLDLSKKEYINYKK